MKRLFAMFLAAMLLFGLVPARVFADGTEIAGGTCGDNMTWNLDDKGTLTISGEGDMTMFAAYDTPWYPYRLDIQAVVVEDGVEFISGWAFFECENLTEVTLPDSAHTIGTAAFRRCKNLETVDLPDSLVAIAADLFSACWNLKSIVLPESINRLYQSAFNGCEKLEEIRIPANVTHLDKWALSACVGMTDLIFAGNAPQIAVDALCYFTGTAWYPAGNSTWTAAILERDYEEASFTWKPYCPDEHMYSDKMDTTCDLCGMEREIEISSVPMHRMYDPNSGEHFYTGSEVERDFLVTAGWHYEGVGFNFPFEGKPVYRLYDPVYGEHLYTMDEAEKAKLISWGWNDEGVAFNSAEDDEVPQYRLHNPNAKRGGYHFTGSIEERDFLISIGWINEGIGWYSCLE